MKPSDIRRFILIEISKTDEDSILYMSKMINAYFFGNFLPSFTIKQNNSLLRGILVRGDTIEYNPFFIKNIEDLEYHLENGMLREVILRKMGNVNLKLFECVSSYLLNDELLYQAKDKIGNIQKIPMLLYKNKQNSCYIDSLISIIFFADYGYYITQILKNNVDTNNYTKGVCSINSNIVNIKEYAKEVQSMLKIMFFDVERTEHTCSLIFLLNKCDTRLKVGTMENVVETYELLCSLFPSLLIQYKRLESDGIYDREQCSFDMTDLPSLSENIKSEPSILTFFNGGITRREMGLIDWKTYGFEETILDEKYQLVGVIQHVDLVHYISYFKINGIWYYYDDAQSDKANPIDELPHMGIFQDSKTKQPGMLFYRKIKK